MRPALVPILLADPMPWAFKAPYAWDFLKDRARFAGGNKGALANTPGWSATPATHSAGGVLYASTASAALQPFASGTLRRTDKGVLIEGARTNLYLQSNNFSASWNLTNVTVTAAAETAPDGTLTAQKVQATTTAATGINQNSSNNATAATFSVYVKKGSGTTEANAFTLRNNTTATNLLVVDVNYDTGAINYTTGSSGVSMTALAGGWWRLVMTATSGITSGDGIRCYPCFNGASETAGEYAYTWGAQLEAAAFPSSYIPTTTASATRAADVLTVPVSGIDYPLTLFAEWQWLAPSAATSRSAVEAHVAGSNTNSAYLRISSNDTVRAVMTAGGVEQAAVNPGVTSVSGSIYKHAGRFALNDVTCALNGTVATADTSASLPTAPTLIRFGAVDGGEPLFGYLRRCALWTRALTDSELQSIST